MVQVRQLKGQSRDFFDPCFLLITLSGLLMNRLTQFRELFIFAKVPVRYLFNCKFQIRVFTKIISLSRFVLFKLLLYGL